MCLLYSPKKIALSISQDSLEPADLVFFDLDNSGQSSHVGIYVGEGVLIHSSTTVGVTHQSIASAYFTNKILGFRRPYGQ